MPTITISSDLWAKTALFFTPLSFNGVLFFPRNQSDEAITNNDTFALQRHPQRHQAVVLTAEFAIFTLSGGVGRVGRRQACWGTCSGRFSDVFQDGVKREGRLCLRNKIERKE